MGAIGAAIGTATEDRQCAAYSEQASDSPTEVLTIAALHERYLDSVFRYVSRRVAGREEAEGVTAEVFATAFAQSPRFRRECPPRLWLLGIARRKVADALRKRGRRRETLASEMPWAGGDVDQPADAQTGADTPEAALQRAEALRVTREVLTALKPEQREELLLQYVEELSIAEIAREEGRAIARWIPQPETWFSIYEILRGLGRPAEARDALLHAREEDTGGDLRQKIANALARGG